MTERPILFSGPMVRAILAGRKTQTRRVINLERLRVRPRREVRSDLPFISEASNHAPLSVDPRWVYSAHLNKAGAVSAVVGTGDHSTIGLKPGEFDFVCPYADGETVLVHGEGWRVIPKADHRLWVKETWCPVEWGSYEAKSRHDYLPPSTCIQYAADPANGYHKPFDAYEAKWRPSIFMPRQFSRITLEVTQVRVERVQEISEGDAQREGVERLQLSSDTIPGVPEPFNKVHPLTSSYVDAFHQLWDSINAKRGFSWDANPWVWVVEFKRVEVSR